MAKEVGFDTHPPMTHPGRGGYWSAEVHIKIKGYHIPVINPYEANMKRVNIIYDGDFADCDIIIVPDNMLSSMRDYLESIFAWLENNRKRETLPEGYYLLINGIKYPALNTQGIVNWLNKLIFGERVVVSIFKEHTRLDPKYPFIEL